MKPIAIAGGGLAGLSLAVALRARRVPVVLREAGSYPRHRVCGEFISGVSNETLDTLGIAEALGDVRQLRATRWFVGDREVFCAELPEAAMGISRHALDGRLARMLVAAGGALETGQRVERTGEEGLVWAAGRPRQKGGGRWLGLKLHALDLAPEGDLEMHVGRGAYVGLASVEGGRTNVCGLFPRAAEVRGQGSELLLGHLRKAGLRRLAERLGAARRDEESFLGVSGFRLGRQRVPEGDFAIGDAESMIPPFTGNGMSMAFQSAEIALAPLLRYARGECAWAASAAAARADLRRAFRRRLAAARALHPFLLSAPGRAVLAAAARAGALPFRAFLRLVR